MTEHDETPTERHLTGAGEPSTEPPPFVFIYRNHRGETGTRRVIPRGIRYGTSEHHPEPCWLLEAWCLDREGARTFALSSVTPAGPDRTVGVITSELVRVLTGNPLRVRTMDGEAVWLRLMTPEEFLAVQHAAAAEHGSGQFITLERAAELVEPLRMDGSR